MTEDTIPLPADLASHGRVLYRGTWLSEVRQPVELRGESNAVRREIWVRLPSGQDKKWRTNEPAFSALPGHQVGALVSPGETDQEFVAGMVNWASGERRMFWQCRRFGLGCGLWTLWGGGALAWAERAPFAWLAMFAALLVFTVQSHRVKKKLGELDARRLNYLADLGPPEGAAIADAATHGHDHSLKGA